MRVLKQKANEAAGELLERGLAIGFNQLIDFELSGGRQRISWKKQGGLMSRDPSPSAYKAMLRHREYFLLLSDYSALQLYYETLNDEILEHRLCYFPCPFKIDDDEQELLDYGLEVLDLIDDWSPNELVERMQLQSPIRFDFDASNSGPSHASSHVHLSRDCCRVPVSHPIDPGRFMAFVLFNFYHTEWVEKDLEDVTHVVNLESSIDREEKWLFYFQRGHWKTDRDLPL